MKSVGTTRDRAGVGAMMRARIGIGAVGVAIGLVGAYAFVVGVPGRDWSMVFTLLQASSSHMTCSSRRLH